MYKHAYTYVNTHTHLQKSVYNDVMKSLFRSLVSISAMHCHPEESCIGSRFGVSVRPLLALILSDVSDINTGILYIQ